MPLEAVNIDLITDLSPCDFQRERVDAIMSVTDRYSKRKRFLLGRKKDGAVASAARFYEGVINEWGWPKTLISDREPRFLGHFWTAILDAAGVRHIETAAYHPSEDGLAERTNQEVEIILRFFVDASQGKWATSLRTIESEPNNSKSSATGRSPNELFYGFNTRTKAEVITSTRLVPGTKIKAGSAKGLIPYADYRTAIREDAVDSIQASQAVMRAASKRTKIDISETGWVYVRLDTGSYTLPSIKKKKLGLQRAGPFKILRILAKGNAVDLELPVETFGKIHNVISVIHLEPAHPPRIGPLRKSPGTASPRRSGISPGTTAK